MALHPGTVETALTAKYLAWRPAVAPAEAATNLLQAVAELRPDDIGGFFAWDGTPIRW